MKDIAHLSIKVKLWRAHNSILKDSIGNEGILSTVNINAIIWLNPCIGGLHFYAISLFKVHIKFKVYVKFNININLNFCE